MRRLKVRPVSASQARLVVSVMGIAFLLGVAFWVLDGALNYYYFRTLLRTMIFEPPASLREAVVSHVSPYALRVRLMFMIACLIGGGIVVVLLSRQATVTAALRVSERRYRTLFERSPEPIILVSAEGVVLDCNDNVVTLGGRKKEDVIGKAFWELGALQPADLESYRQVFRQWLTSPTFAPLELEIKVLSGEMRWIEIYPARVDPERETSNVLIIARDIHERKQTLEALSQSEATLQSIFRVAPIGIGMVRHRVMVWTNEGLQKMVGYSADELHGQSARVLYPDEQEFQRVGEVKYDQINQTGTGTVITRFQRKDGTIIDVQLSSTPSNPNDLSVGVIFTALDISDLVRVQTEIRQLNRDLEQRVQQRTVELTAVNHELEAFAYSVSHDLRAPLRSIEGFGHILAEDQSGCLDAAGQSALQRILAASQRMGQMINDLLTLSRTTQSTIVRSTVDLSAIVNEIAADLRAGQPERDVTWTIAAHVQAEGDARLLRLALENLLGNAWKFTGKQPQATIEFGLMTLDGERVYFVRDDGRGFDMAYAHNLFGAFQRLHSAAEFEGTGVGLATVQRIVRRHGGRVWADAAPDQGATFYFTLVSLESATD